MSTKTRVCSDCHIEFTMENFHRKGNGWRYSCKSCRKVQEKEYRRLNSTPEKQAKARERAKNYREKNPDAHWNSFIKSYYNITVEEWNILLKSQNYLCAICKSPYSEQRERLSVDHDHSCCVNNKSCGKCIRGLVCQPCNKMLGFARDSTIILQSAIDYLKESFNAYGE